MLYPTRVNKDGRINACISMKRPHEQKPADFNQPHVIYPLTRLQFSGNEDIWNRAFMTLNNFLSEPAVGLDNLNSNVFSTYKRLLVLRTDLIESLNEVAAGTDNFVYEDEALVPDEFVITKFDSQLNILNKQCWEAGPNEHKQMLIGVDGNICSLGSRPSQETKRAIHIKHALEHHWSYYLNEVAEVISSCIIETDMIGRLYTFVITNNLTKDPLFGSEELTRLVTKQTTNQYGYIDVDEFDQDDKYIMCTWSLLIKMWFPVIDTIIDNGGLSRLYQFFRLLVIHLFEKSTDHNEYFITRFERNVAKLSMIIDQNHYQISILNQPSSLDIKNDQIIIVMYLMIQLLYFNPTADNQVFECFNLGWLSLQANQFYYQSMML